MVKFIYSKVCQFCYGVNKIIYCFIIPCVILAKVYSQAHIFFLWPWKDWCNMVIYIFHISVRDVYLIRIYELWNIKYHCWRIWRRGLNVTIFLLIFRGMICTLCKYFLLTIGLESFDRHQNKRVFRLSSHVAKMTWKCSPKIKGVRRQKVMFAVIFL